MMTSRQYPGSLCHWTDDEGMEEGNEEPSRGVEVGPCWSDSMARDSTLLPDVGVDSLSGSCVSDVEEVASHLPMGNEGAARWLGGGGLRKWGGRDIAHRQAYQVVGLEVSLWGEYDQDAKRE